jgi:hypothetical protein
MSLAPVSCKKAQPTHRHVGRDAAAAGANMIDLQKKISA